ncbi:hypothetical protein [Actinomadura sp. WMMA1423]|uniref:hypothetical protein n=1 Tax=Actinomadura sp. WMMA1423 TaxID=2591108 RepID=UPI0011465F2E|nr:hypothetical protein [Actinomadura sp. WMMA1423]
MEIRTDGGMPDQDEIAKLRAQAEAGDRNAAGRLGELLAKHGDPEAALHVWARAYGDASPTTRRLAELLADRGDLRAAVEVWQFSDPVRQNPDGLHEDFLAALDTDDRIDWEDDPEDWAFMEREHLTTLLPERGDETALA